jgi:dihydrolipoamide dehydrogenase
MQVEKFDYVVIGAGPGGYVSAIRAAQLGKKVAIIEAEHLGGICLNWGCIPTKSLLRSAEIHHYIKNAKSYGLSADNISANIKEIVARSRGVAAQLSSGVSMLLKKNKIKIFSGLASFISSTKIKVDGKDNIEIESSAFVIATGARARVIAGFEPDEKNILTYKEAMVLDQIPKSILVVGSGAIGIEFASFYNEMGSDVTVIEAQDRILPVEDTEISELAKKSFEKSGMKIITSAKLKKLENSKTVRATFEVGGKDNVVEVEKVIMAVGVVPNTEKLNLKNTKVKLSERGTIIVDESMKTLDSNIYAIGDVTDGPWLAHKASHEGIIAAEHFAGKKTKPIDRNKIPGCTYSAPQIASIGITERFAKEKNMKVKIGRFPFMGNGKAIALGEPDGLMKIIFDEKTGEILGAHMIGAEVTELISNIALAMTLEATEEDLFHTIFPHPTLSEMLHEVSLSAFGKAIHI